MQDVRDFSRSRASCLVSSPHLIGSAYSFRITDQWKYCKCISEWAEPLLRNWYNFFELLRLVYKNWWEIVKVSYFWPIDRHSFCKKAFRGHSRSSDEVYRSVPCCVKEPCKIDLHRKKSMHLSFCLNNVGKSVWKHAHSITFSLKRQPGAV